MLPARTRLAAMAIVTAAASPAFGVVFSDSFDANGARYDNDGSDAWHARGWRMNVNETEGSLRVTGRGGWANGGVVSRNTFDVFNNEGLTYEWVSSGVDITRTDANRYDHSTEYAVLNSSMTNPTKAIHWWNKSGGLYVRLSYEAGDGTTPIVTTGQLVYAQSNKTVRNNNNSLTLAQFTINGYHGSESLSTMLHVSDNGLALGFNSQSGAAALSWADTEFGATEGNMFATSWDHLGMQEDAATVFANGSRFAALAHSSKDGQASNDFEELNVYAGNQLAFAHRASVPTQGAGSLLAVAGVLTLRGRRRRNASA